MTHSKHTMAALIGLTLALTACSSEQGAQIQELPRPDFIEAGQNFTGAPHFKYTLGPGEAADCDGPCEVTVDSCGVSYNAHTVAIIRPGVSEQTRYESGCSFGDIFRSTYTFTGEVMAVAGGQKLPSQAQFVMPASGHINDYCINHSDSFMAAVRIVGDKYWIVHCLPIEAGSLAPIAVDEELIVQLPGSFEELSREVTAVLSNYQSLCDREDQTESYETIDDDFARHEECPLREARPNPEPEDDEPGGDEFEN